MRISFTGLVHCRMCYFLYSRGEAPFSTWTKLPLYHPISPTGVRINLENGEGKQTSLTFCSNTPYPPNRTVWILQDRIREGEEGPAQDLLHRLSCHGLWASSGPSCLLRDSLWLQGFGLRRASALTFSLSPLGHWCVLAPCRHPSSAHPPSWTDHSKHSLLPVPPISDIEQIKSEAIWLNLR